MDLLIASRDTRAINGASSELHSPIDGSVVAFAAAAGARDGCLHCCPRRFAGVRWGVDEAVHVANGTDYSWSAAVFCQDLGRAFDVARSIKSGICHTNGPTAHDGAQVPFGGTKASGYGRFGDEAATNKLAELRRKTLRTQGHRPVFVLT
nr:aldehyde dehydrogenase family protein [Candidimonas nitroreducens]